ncbi:hypothetical protein B0O99DRAFT_627495 [Bisporella sp. PMI_857]|nr:hypothetical protein B0O99DRAFT_627495 [Bisporella sp. PMI_857]
MSGESQKRDSEDQDAEAASPAASLDNNNNNKKRKTGTTSSRGVANLTPEQLAKKRANDREAQRAIRERTKNQIENLEKQIHDLRSQQPYQELQHVLRQKEMVEAENADIKKRLATVLSLIQPIIGQHGLEAMSYSAPAPPAPYINPPPNPPSHLHISPPITAHSPSSSSGPWQNQNTSPGGQLNHDSRALTQAQQSQTQQLNQQRYELEHNLDMGPEKLGLDFLLSSDQRTVKILTGMNGIPAPVATPSSFQQLPQGPASEAGSPANRRSNSVSSSSPYTNNSTTNQIPPGGLTGHSAPIKNSPPTCPLDSLLLDFLHERQSSASSGASPSTLVGPAYPSVSSLLNPSKSASSHPLSKVFTDILATFPDLSTLPEKVAVLYIMFLLMRWQISPTPANYDRLPSWMTPRPSQIFTPHPAWIDHLPFPKMRDRLVANYNPRDYLFDNFFIPFTTTLSLNWEYEPTDCLLSSSESDELMINPVFERHLRRLENWSLGSAFAKAFPALRDTCRIKVDGDRRT